MIVPTHDPTSLGQGRGSSPEPIVSDEATMVDAYFGLDPELTVESSSVTGGTNSNLGNFDFLCLPSICLGSKQRRPKRRHKKDTKKTQRLK